jgi:hypothetical protein
MAGLARALAGCSFLVLAAAGCPHAGGTLDDGVFRQGPVAFRIGEVPSGWRRIDVEAADLAFRDDAREGSVLVNARCGEKSDDVPLTALTHHLVIGTTDREFVSQKVVPFDGREAEHTILRAKLDGVPMQYDIYVMKKNGCVYDLVYVAPPARFDEGAPVFEHFAESVHTVATSGER